MSSLSSSIRSMTDRSFKPLFIAFLHAQFHSVFQIISPALSCSLRLSVCYAMDPTTSNLPWYASLIIWYISTRVKAFALRDSTRLSSWRHPFRLGICYCLNWTYLPVPKHRQSDLAPRCMDGGTSCYLPFFQCTCQCNLLRCTSFRLDLAALQKRCRHRLAHPRCVF